jgi:hypothetical protein
MYIWGPVKMRRNKEQGDSCLPSTGPVHHLKPENICGGVDGWI